MKPHKICTLTLLFLAYYLVLLFSMYTCVCCPYLYAYPVPHVLYNSISCMSLCQV